MTASAQQEFIAGSSNIHLRTHNVCWFHGEIAAFEGTSSGMHAYLKTSCAGDYNNYQLIDSLLTFQRINFLEFDEMESTLIKNKLICLGNQSMLISYMLGYTQINCSSLVLIPADTLLTDSISDVQVFDDNIFLIRSSSTSNNVIQYDSVFNQINALTLNTTPQLLNVYYSFAYIVGVNNNNQITITTINCSNFQIVGDTVLGALHNKPFTLDGTGNILFSQPGDSMVSAYNLFQRNNSILFHGSGAQVSTWNGGELNFQPVSDSTGLDKQIIVIQNTGQNIRTTFQINKRLQFLDNPAHNYYGWNYTYAMEENNDSICYVYNPWFYNLTDSFPLSSKPTHFVLDFRCPHTSVPETDSRIHWKIYPNPTSHLSFLEAGGLKCEMDYKLDIIDQEGAIHFERTIQAKMLIELPTANLKPGIYFVRIHTTDRPYVQKIVKM